MAEQRTEYEIQYREKGEWTGALRPYRDKATAQKELEIWRAELPSWEWRLIGRIITAREWVEVAPGEVA